MSVALLNRYHVTNCVDTVLHTHSQECMSKDQTPCIAQSTLLSLAADPCQPALSTGLMSWC